MNDLITFTQMLAELEENWPNLPITQRREIIEEFQKRVQLLEVTSPCEPHITHHFGNGTYGREANVPAGAVIVGSIYEKEELNILLKGKVFVATEHSIKMMEGTQIFISEPNTKKVGYVIEDMQWITVLSRGDELSPDAILKAHTIESYGG